MSFRQVLPRMLIVLTASLGMLEAAPAAESVKYNDGLAVRRNARSLRFR